MQDPARQTLDYAHGEPEGPDWTSVWADRLAPAVAVLVVAGVALAALLMVVALNR